MKMLGKKTSLKNEHWKIYKYSWQAHIQNKLNTGQILY